MSSTRTCSRACLAPRPVRGESASSTAGGGQVANFATEVHGLIMVSAVVNGIACPFLIDTGADVSLLPLEVVQRHALPIRLSGGKFDLMSLRIGLGWWKSRRSWLTARDCWAVLLLSPAGKTR